jgi:hypothetical protein
LPETGEDAMSDDQETEMRAARQFLMMIPPERLADATKALCEIYVSVGPDRGREHLEQLKKHRWPLYVDLKD